MMDYCLQCKNIHYSYSQDTQVIDNISFNVKEGEKIGLVGANGAGKTTLLNLILGIASPRKGTIIVGDLEVNKKNLSYIRNKVGFVFQNADDQLFMPSVYDDIAFGLRNCNISEDQVKDQVDKVLKVLNIYDLKERPPYKLSGGEKRAVAIATVLAMDPKIIIMDEPTIGLDPKSRRQLINFLKVMNKTLIIATHDMDMVWELCSRAIVMDKGKLIEDGNSSEILSNKEVMDNSSLEVPLYLQGYRAAKKEA